MTVSSETKPFSVSLGGSVPTTRDGLEAMFASSQFQAFADLMPDPLIVVSPENTVMFASAAFEKHGLTTSNLPLSVFLRKADWDLDEFVAATERGQSQGIARRISTGRVFIATRRVLLFEGSSRGFNVYWLRDPDGWDNAKRGTQSRVVARGDTGSIEKLSFPADLQLQIDRAKKAYERSFRVLLLGPSGVGKTAVAKHIHLTTGSGGRPFVHVNCSSIPESLFESEMFGYERGAFTGALQAGKRGYIESAGGGTLFLDEIGEMPFTSQAKLLKFLEDGTIQSVGSAVNKKVETRVIAATNRDLHHMMTEGLFRKDLYFRLATFPVHIPPLSERADKGQILDNLLAVVNSSRKRALKLSPACRSAILRHAFPGNLRELKSIVEYLDIVAEDVATPEHLPACFPSAAQPSSPAYPEAELAAHNGMSLKDLTRAYEDRIIEGTIRKYGSKREAARHLGVDIATLVRKTTRGRTDV